MSRAAARRRPLAALPLLLAGCVLTAGVEERWLGGAMVIDGPVELRFKEALEPRHGRLAICLVLPAGQGPLTAAVDLAGPRAAAAPRATLLGEGGPVELEGLTFLTDRRRTLACFQERAAGATPRGGRWTGVILRSGRPLPVEGVVARDAEAR